MSKSLLLLLCLLVFTPVGSHAHEGGQPQQYWVFLGTYTTPDGSRGIYRSSFDPATGQLSQPELAMEIDSPSFLHIAPDGKSLYAVNESNEEGDVVSYHIDPTTGQLTHSATLRSGGATACHISTDAANQFAVVSNYFGGSFAFFKLQPNGSLESQIAHYAIPVLDVEGESRAARGHCGFFDATGTLALTCDAGQDKVHLYRLDRETGTVTPNDPPFLEMPALSAPRHIHIAADNTVAFVNGERDMTVNVVRMDVAANRFEVVQSLSTLRDGESVQPGYSTAECRIHPNGKFVYVSNRGHDTIAVFKYDASAMRVSRVGHVTGEIKVPRNFNITPCGNWMLIASQDGGKVGVYRIDPNTGLATETDNAIKIDRCVCIKFLPQP
jgi:6-phosphogluconolactonase